MSDQDFVDMYKVFLAQASKYPPSQRQMVLQRTRQALHELLLSLPPPAQLQNSGEQQSTISQQAEVETSPLDQATTQALEAGMATMRETLRTRNKSLLYLFKIMKTDKGMPIQDLAASMLGLGFPHGKVTTDQIVMFATCYSNVNEGHLTYKEFVNLIEGGPKEPVQVTHMSILADNPELRRVLVKVNNQNLRKIFKDMDTGNDGMITTQQLAAGLLQQGLSPAIAQNPGFATYVETFCKRKAGLFGYSDFIRLLNFRPHTAQPSAGEKTAVPPDWTPSQIMQLLHKKARTLSVCKLLEQYDPDREGVLRLQSFPSVLSVLGVNVNEKQAAGLFVAFDHAQTGCICTEEFARTIANPNRNRKLDVVVRQSPGGETTIPLGGGQNDGGKDVELVTPRTRGPPGGAQHFDFTQGPAELPQINRASTLTMSTVDLSTTLKEGEVIEQPRRQLKKTTGGDSILDFAGDHGASMHRDPASIRHTPGVASTWDFAHDGERSHEENLRKPRPKGQTGGACTFDVSEQQSNTPVQRPRPLTTVKQPSGGHSSVSMNQSDRVVHRPSRRVAASPGGSSTLALGAEGEREVHRPSRRIAASPGGDSTLDLGTEPRTGQQLRAPSTGEEEPQAAEVIMADIEAAADAVDDKPTAAPAASPALVNASPAPVANGDPDALDRHTLEQIAKAVYGRGRVRATFKYLKSTSPGQHLPKDAFQAGLGRLKVKLSDAQVHAIFAKFDKNGTGCLTYSEFVRMLATTSAARSS